MTLNFNKLLLINIGLFTIILNINCIVPYWNREYKLLKSTNNNDCLISSLVAYKNVWGKDYWPGNKIYDYSIYFNDSCFDSTKSIIDSLKLLNKSNNNVIKEIFDKDSICAYLKYNNRHVYITPDIKRVLIKYNIVNKKDDSVKHCQLEFKKHQYMFPFFLVD